MTRDRLRKLVLEAYRRERLAPRLAQLGGHFLWLLDELASDTWIRSAFEGCNRTRVTRPVDQAAPNLTPILRKQMMDVAAEVAAENGLTLADLLGKCRSPVYAKPRHEAMLACRDKLDASFANIGVVFNRDHSTVIHGCRKAREA